MYFRNKKSKTGNILQLVESYRDTEGNPRQRIVISLGSANIDEENRAEIAKGVEKRLYNREEMFDWPLNESAQAWIDQIVRKVDMNGRWQPMAAKLPGQIGARGKDETVNDVLINEVGHEQSCLLGPVLLARQAWARLQMDGCLEDLGFNGPQRRAAAAAVINRLIDPVSENALSAWIANTSMPELFGQDLLTMPRDRFYRASDKLLKHSEAIEAHLRIEQRKTLSFTRTLLLYDLTNTYFEGKAHLNPKAKRGKSKHKRSDCPQIVIGMVFDEHGFELGHKIFPGNRHDSPTLVDMVEAMEKIVEQDSELFPPLTPIVVLDGGLASAKNLELLRSKGFGYFVNESRNGRKTYAEHFKSDEGFVALKRRAGQSSVQVKKILDPKAQAGAESTDSVVLCKSQGREQKESAIRSTAEERLVTALEKLQKRIDNGKLKEPKKIQRAIGALLSKNSRVARFYEVDLLEDLPPNEKGVTCKLHWQLRDQSAQEDQELLGCYAIRTDRQGLGAESIWETYMMLTHAEDGFRALKSDLGLRPNRHHVERRVDGHVFICVLAYHLYQHIRYRLKQQGDNRSWETIKRLLSSHCYATVIVPTKNDGTHRIRKAGRPDQTQRAIYNSLDVEWRNLPAVRRKTSRD